MKGKNLTGQTTKARIPFGPKQLSATSRALWRSILREWELVPYQCSILTQALASLDRANEAREILDRDGLVVRDRFNQVKEHPAVTMERQSRLAYARLLRELNLGNAADLARLPRWDGDDR